ncbi:hypothetical protein [Nakamurella aerolata]|uniref:hypothetical protein n=1 Tax=Nakamurella aerolata TaxID=1656892 RepID=UPI001BB0ED41|nr:hypothetical protein [Nakamurella aerolata]
MDTQQLKDRFDGFPAKIKERIETTIGDAALAVKLKVGEILNKDADVQSHAVTPAGRAGLKSGEVSELTLIAPLKPGGAEKLRRFFSIVDGNLWGAGQVGTLHNMRFVFLDDDTKLLFATAYDGEWDPYIDDFATKIRT